MEASTISIHSGASPAFCVFQEKGKPEKVLSWRWDERGMQTVPAIEVSLIAVVKFPVDYYRHFNYSPDLMDLRRGRIKELGWDSQSFDLPCTPEIMGTYSLLTDALKVAREVLGKACGRGSQVERIYPSTVRLTTDYGSARADYVVLFFNGAAYEFYDLLFQLGKKDTVQFENIPDPKINTLPYLLKWARAFETRKRAAYKQRGFTWEPVRRVAPQEGE